MPHDRRDIRARLRCTERSFGARLLLVGRYLLCTTMRVRFLPLIFVAACNGASPYTPLLVSAEVESMALSMLEGVEGLDVRATDDPARSRRGDQIALVLEDSCAGCYTVEAAGAGYVIRGDRSGLAYGLTEALEALGYRFNHPFTTHVPDSIAWPPMLEPGSHIPWIEQRGLQLHTLHPIEALEPFWVPGEQNLENACAITRWIVRQRGNYVHWVGLDDISDRADDASLQAWREHTRGITECAHELGATTGLGVQLFGSSNLQKAFDLIDDTSIDVAEQESEMRRRLQLIAGVGLDLIGISFGEFSGEDPDVFITSLDRANQIIREELPEVEVSATVHVGDSDEQKVVYMGEELIYYFLLQFASEPVTPWVHTVMYYALDDDAGGVYHHDDFHEHFDMLRDFGARSEPVVHHPETGYWVAWDNSLPMYLPVYSRARHRDLLLLEDTPPSGHVIFSTGWEWGYWQYDLVSLRASYELPERWEVLLEHAYADQSAAAELAAAVAELADVQHEHLVVERLAAYLAGRDSLIELGFGMDVIAQPDRIEPANIAAMEDAELDTFEAGPLAGLRTLADESERLSETVQALVDETRFGRELADSFEIAALRSRFVAEVYTSAVAHRRSGSFDLTMVDTALQRATEVVARRHAALLHVDPEAITATRRRLPTLYGYGYLREADTLCFWRRERIKLEALETGETSGLPACVL